MAAVAASCYSYSSSHSLSFIDFYYSNSANLFTIISLNSFFYLRVSSLDSLKGILTSNSAYNSLDLSVAYVISDYNLAKFSSHSSYNF